MKGDTRFFALLALALLLAACATPAPATREPVGAAAPYYVPILLFVESDQGKTFQIVLGDPISIGLPSNPTTGYLWQIVPASLGGLTQSGERTYVPTANTGQRVGVGGTDNFLLRASRIGNFTVQLDYLRPFETGVAPARTWSATFRVWPKPAVSLNDSDDGKTVSLHVGETVAIALASGKRAPAPWKIDESTLGGLDVVGPPVSRFNFNAPLVGWESNPGYHDADDYHFRLGAAQVGQFKVRIIQKPANASLINFITSTWTATFVVQPDSPP